MRDLASRLRGIVKQDHGGRPTPVRDLTYVPEPDGPARHPADVADRLGGTAFDGHLAIDRVWESDRRHGRREVSAFVPRETSPLRLFDPRAAQPSWADRVVFFDLETTGLSGGAGTLAFLAGCGWFEGGAFRVRQFLLTAPSGERAMLDAIARIFGDASLLVTFNGRTFDVPLMEMRWAYHRAAAPIDDLPHFDMLPVSRRLWGRREDSPDRSSCTLGSLERALLGFHRIGDVPGFEIPARYFHFLRTGHVDALIGVLDHNRHDLLSLAGVMARALSLAEEGPEACRLASEQLALGRLYEGAGDPERALAAFALASRGTDKDVRVEATARLAAIHARAGRHDEAASGWRQVLDHARRWGGPEGLVRRATEALAIHHEHRARDLGVAHEYAERLRRQTSGRRHDEAARRLSRIERKLKTKGALLS